MFGGLANAKNAPKSGSGAGAAAAGKGGGKKSGASGADISGYLGQITGAIQSKFYDADLYKGRTCDLRIKLAPDGLLIDVKAEGGTRHCARLLSLRQNKRKFLSLQVRMSMNNLRMLRLCLSLNKV